VAIKENKKERTIQSVTILLIQRSGNWSQRNRECGARGEDWEELAEKETKKVLEEEC